MSSPLLAYHGTTAEFSSFSSQPNTDAGFHFGTRAQAKMRAAGKGGERLLVVELSVTRLKRMKDTGRRWTKTHIAAARRQGYDGIVYLNRFEGVTIENVIKASQAEIDLEKISDREFKKWFPEAEDSYMVFDPGQIKIKEDVWKA